MRKRSNINNFGELNFAFLLGKCWWYRRVGSSWCRGLHEYSFYMIFPTETHIPNTFGGGGGGFPLSRDQLLIFVQPVFRRWQRTYEFQCELSCEILNFGSIFGLCEFWNSTQVWTSTKAICFFQLFYFIVIYINLHSNLHQIFL
jgi:hypothetical protein